MAIEKINTVAAWDAVNGVLAANIGSINSIESAAEVKNLLFNDATTEIEYTTAALVASTSVTMDAMVYPTSFPLLTDLDTVFCHGTSSDCNYRMIIDKDKYVSVQWYNGTWRYHISSAALTINTWNHVCGIIKPGVADGIKIYINGSLNVEATNANTIISNSGQRLKSGRDRNDDYEFDGYMKNLIVTIDSDVAGSEILEHAAGNYTNVTSPTVYWKLDEETGVTANDSSGNGYDGTIANGSWAVI